MEIEQVAELARAVAGLPEDQRDFFESMLADERAATADAERIAKLRATSDEDVVRKALVECTEYGQHHDEHDALKILREAGFVRANLKPLREAREALEAVVKVIVDMTPRLVDPPHYPEMQQLNDLIMRAATALGTVEAGRS